MNVFHVKALLIVIFYESVYFYECLNDVACNRAVSKLNNGSAQYTAYQHKLFVF